MVVAITAGMAVRKPRKSQNPILKGRFEISGGGKIMPVTSLVDSSYGINAEMRNTRPNPNARANNANLTKF